jgi:hypothetical protein
MTMPTEPMPIGGHFSAGYDAGRGPSGTSPGLEAQGQRWTAMGAASAQAPQSVLHQVGLSALSQNASSPSMASRWNSFTGTVLPNLQTGASENTAQTALKLKFAGQEGV